VRMQAAHSLSRLGTVPIAALPSIVAALRDEASRVRMYAAAALKAMGPEARPAYLAVLEVLTNDEDESVRWYISRALDEMERPDNQDMELAIETLINALKHVDAEVRSVAARAIARIGPDGHAAIPALLQAVQDTPEVRFGAICALRSIGPSATAAVPILVQALKDEDAGVRSVSAQALREIRANTQAVVSALGEAMKDTNQEVRLWAAQALVAIGAQNESCVPVLEEVLSSPSVNREIRERAAESLSQLGR
jgi:HEAT repeat protein